MARRLERHSHPVEAVLAGDRAPVNLTGLERQEFHNLVKGNRRICLLLLAQYDDERVIECVGDWRLITDQGRSLLKTLFNR